MAVLGSLSVCPWSEVCGLSVWSAGGMGIRAWVRGRRATLKAFCLLHRERTGRWGSRWVCRASGRHGDAFFIDYGAGSPVRRIYSAGRSV